MKIGGELGYRCLRWLKPGTANQDGTDPPFSYIQKVKQIVGQDGWESLRGKTILDFGCGSGDGCIEMAQHGATHVIGLDIRLHLLDVAKSSAERAGVADKCTFSDTTQEQVDVIVSIDAFEHFDNPMEILSTMNRLLAPDGSVIVSFGPTWYHPYGGHLFSIFPWSHLVFSESALIRWRSDFKHDGATRFSEVSGGLNMITIKRFEELVRQSNFSIESFRAVPIKPLTWAHNPITREFTTSAVECKLVKEPEGSRSCRTASTTPR
ncbi:MAG: class I SAM-dependent methyltransferase [Nitrospirales bacterium]|nr:class I SAM-dependent methyltransferase [Nitrospira sp.]MDR4501931.1 class I SAM-dependent methyltransferase [Nitrospirales bacterium]